jgi:hypothetical protein
MLTSWAIAAIVWGLFAVGVAVLVLRRRASRRGIQPNRGSTTNGPGCRPGHDRASG